MTNPIETKSNTKTNVYLSLADLIRTITMFDEDATLNKLSSGISMWLSTRASGEDLCNVVLCIDATNAPTDFNYLSLIRALTLKSEHMDVHSLTVAGIVVGGIPLSEQRDNSVLYALDIVSHLTSTPYMIWTDHVSDANHSVPKIRGHSITGNSAVLFEKIKHLLSEDFEDEFTYKLLMDGHARSGGASSALKTLHNKYPAILTETRIVVTRPDNKGNTSSYKYKLTGFKAHAKTSCCPTQTVGT